MTTPPRARVFIVDDHPLVRESLATLVGQQPDLAVCGEAGSAPAALAGIAKARPDVAVVDLSLGEGSGLDLVKDLHRLYPRVAVLVLSMHDEELYAERALRAGARGYIMKREATRQVVVAIRRVLEGGRYLSERLAAALAEKWVSGTATTTSPVELLSDRELEVFRLLGRGHATRQIAEALHVSVKTVQAFAARIKLKLGLQSSTELLREAIRWVEREADR